MTPEEPSLPGLYDLVVVDTTDSAHAHAARLAAAGADEGTLVWARKQTEAMGRPGKYWISGEGNLHCAVVLRPEDPFETCCQLSLLAGVCLSQAITLVGEPMEELRLGWPNDVYLNRGKVGSIHLSGELGSGDRVEWMVVSLNANTHSHPTSLGFNASSLRGEGFEVFDRVALLEAYSREFLAWINRWADEGLQPVRKAWLWRGDWDDGERRVEVDGQTIQGRFDSLDERGALKLASTEGTITVTLSDFYRPLFTVRS
ncbi:MAG TPA: biotin--[acetyl-CoA-carboxylase] ligase [Arenicellales bacterium]|nr:biotin--[acetyl-CoA-carboxylase] ligase [Arenicellales bacterium]